MELSKNLDLTLSYFRAAGPAGKARRFFEAISKLPRHQQEKVFSLLAPFIDQHASNGHAATK